MWENFLGRGRVCYKVLMCVYGTEDSMIPIPPKSIGDLRNGDGEFIRALGGMLKGVPA